MHTIKIGNKTRELPSDYGEITARQLLRCISIVNNFSINEDLRREIVVYELLNIPRKLFNQLKLFQVLEISESVNFLFDKPTGLQVLKSFEHNNVRYYTSGDDFKHFTLLEFAYSDMYFEQFIKSESADENFLNLLCASICRRKTKHNINLADWNGDMREQFNEARHEIVAQEFKTLDVSIKLAMLKYFVGSRLKLVEDYKLIFESDGGDGSTKTSFIPVWFDLIFELAKSNVFGDWDKVASTELHKIMIHLALEKQNNNRLKKK